MNSKRKKNYAKSSAIGLFIVLFVFLPLFQLKPPIMIPAADGNIPEFDQNIPISQGSYDLTNLPYFENISGVTDWVSSNIVDEATFPQSPTEPNYPMYFGLTNEDSSSILDDNHYLEDFNVMFDGLLQKTYPDLTNSELIEYYLRLNEFDYRDKNQENLYLSYLNQDFSDNSSQIEANGNFQIILSLIDWVINNEPASLEATSIIQDQWNNIDALLWDTLAYSTNNNSADKFLTDQFIAAISGFMIYQAGISSIESSALSKAQSLMTTVVTDSGADTYQNDVFINSMDSTFENPLDDNIYLSTNAYAIWSLVEWATNDPSASESDISDRISMAESIFQTMKSLLWNDTLSLYMTSAYAILTPFDTTVDLQDNSLIMLASLKLFQATGNFTYFDNAYQVFQGIESNLKDDTNGNYFNSIETANNIIDTDKELGSHAYYYRSLANFEELAQKTSITFAMNETSVMYGVEETLNITGIYNLEYDLGLTNKIVGIDNFADCYLVIRYPNSSILIEEQLETGYKGQVSYLFNTTEDLSLYPGEYQISLRFNYTGLQTQSYDSLFSIESGIYIEEIEFTEEGIKAGAIAYLDLQLNSSYQSNTSITLNISGDVVQNSTQILEMEPNLIDDEPLLNNYTIEVQTLVDAEFGLSPLQIILCNDSFIFEAINHSITILSPVVLQQFSQDNYAYKESPFNVDLMLESFSDLDTPISIAIEGSYIESLSYQTNILARSEPNINLKVNLTNNAPYGIIYFNFEITRTTDGQIIYSQLLSTTVEQSIEIIDISKPTEVSHGQDVKVIYELYNYLPQSQNITVEIYHNGVFVSTYDELISENENTLVIDLGSINNPYSLSSENYEIYLKTDDGEILSHESVDFKINPSVWSIIFGYIVPIAIPICGIIIMKHLAMENKKRLG